jgi:hypothetical protein
MGRKCSPLFRKTEGRTEGLYSSETKFTPGGQLHPWALHFPLGAKLKTGLRFGTPANEKKLSCSTSASGAYPLGLDPVVRDLLDDVLELVLRLDLDVGLGPI